MKQHFDKVVADRNYRAVSTSSFRLVRMICIHLQEFEHHRCKAADALFIYAFFRRKTDPSKRHKQIDSDKPQANKTQRECATNQKVCEPWHARGVLEGLIVATHLHDTNNLKKANGYEYQCHGYQRILLDTLQGFHLRRHFK
ncbi:hypothetical protein PsorP6_015365 [Peronosclerospora sorghi]|uniref:Uncharacterized protein n=1 Tax=Peronosclerospora sorghi TaxID=230839 RepID=A0ACC0WMX0_9STRA|nr:hypothetical protein PsorP6_015365 [Peronosclerospora sorghi]